MPHFLVSPVKRLRGKIELPGDKSIAHRGVIVSVLVCGKTILRNFPANNDCLATIEAFKKLGIKIITSKEKAKKSLKVVVFGKGLYGLKKSVSPIFVGDSGTTLRLILGVLAGQNFETKLFSGKSLTKRPMRRVTEPLRIMGAKISAQRAVHNVRQEEYPPITIKGGELKPINYRMPVASAQVKSAILLAGLYAKGSTEVIETYPTRDHTERMLKLFKAGIQLKQNKIVIKAGSKLISPGKVYIPGDMSSASFFIVLASILPDAQILIKNISLNPLRAGILKVLRRMGAKIGTKDQKLKTKGYEPIGDLVVKNSFLRGARVKKEEIPSLIDELPILMVASAFAHGKSVFEGVNELRVKETDRIESMLVNLKKMGVSANVIKNNGLENIIIQGARELKGAKLSSFGDHRTAMSLIVAALAVKGKTTIDDISCINKSFPDFLAVLKSLKH